MKNQGIKLDNYDIIINKSRFLPLINHFIKYYFGHKALTNPEPVYQAQDYQMLLKRLFYDMPTNYNRLAVFFEDTDGNEKSLFLSFLQNISLDFLNNPIFVSIKDELSYAVIMISVFEYLKECGIVFDDLKIQNVSKGLFYKQYPIRGR